MRIAQEGADWIEDEAARADVQRWIDESGEPYDQWKANGRGVDLNRNFDARWDEQTEERATAGPAYAFYRGENPESEPETQALVELTNDFGPDSTISYHSRGGIRLLVLRPDRRSAGSRRDPLRCASAT